MLPLTAAQLAACAAPDLEPHILVEIEAADGVYYFAKEPIVYGGVQYSPRVLSTPTITTDIQGAATGSPGGRSVTITLANADGFFSRWRPETYRGQVLRIKEVALAVDSNPIRTYEYTLTGASFSDDGCVLEALEQWGDVGRRLVPRLTFDAITYPDMDVSNIGKPIPLLFGRALVPLTLVDDRNEEENRFVACCGSAALTTLPRDQDFNFNDYSTSGQPGFGAVYQSFNGQLWRVDSARAEVKERNGFPITEVLVRSPVWFNGAPMQHYADLTSQDSGGQLYPDVVLERLIHGQFAANAIDVKINSASLISARSFYEASSLRFSCVLTEQKTLEQYLGDWGYSALTNVILRGEVRLIPQQSAAPVSSLHIGNIIAPLQVQDLSMLTEDTTHAVGYTDRTSGQQALAAYQAGSGSVFSITSPFLGTPLCAGIVAQYRARRATVGLRNYSTVVGPDMIALEAGDIVTLQHSLHCPDLKTVEVIQTVGTLTGETQISLREIDYSVYSNASIVLNHWFPRYGETINVNQAATPAQGYAGIPTNFNFTLNQNSWGFTFLHHLGFALDFVIPTWEPKELSLVIQASIVAVAANSATVGFTYFGTQSISDLQSKLRKLDCFAINPWVTTESFTTYREEVIADQPIWYWRLTDGPKRANSLLQGYGDITTEGGFGQNNQHRLTWSNSTGVTIQSSIQHLPFSRPGETMTIFSGALSYIQVETAAGASNYFWGASSLGATFEFIISASAGNIQNMNSEQGILYLQCSAGFYRITTQGSYGDVRMRYVQNSFGGAVQNFSSSLGLSGYNLYDGSIHNVAIRQAPQDAGGNSYLDFWVDGVMVNCRGFTPATVSFGGQNITGYIGSVGSVYAAAIDKGCFGICLAEVAVYSMAISSVTLLKHARMRTWAGRDGGIAGGSFNV